MFSYLGVMAVHAGMIDFKDLRPAFLRLLPPFRAQIALLPALRASLQKEIRTLVKKYGSELGPVYNGKMKEWNHAAVSLSASPSANSLSTGNFLNIEGAQAAKSQQAYAQSALNNDKEAAGKVGDGVGMGAGNENVIGSGSEHEHDIHALEHRLWDQLVMKMSS